MRTLACLVMLATSAVAAPPAGWTPSEWVSASTVELATQSPGEEVHWFPVWLAVIDDQAYVRLGSRAAGRFDANVTKPFIGVRIAGKTFPRVRGVVVPEMADKVAAIMASKYWTDVAVRYMTHPYTLRLDPEPSATP
jgi:hypothetical protein